MPLTNDYICSSIVTINDAYEIVVGLETHAQLLTQSKLFSGDGAEFEPAPNKNISPVVLAHPGTLPMINKKAIEFAVKMGLACHCAIVKENFFARKNYFYPDLPKGYQISQHTTPVCKGGFIEINTDEGNKKIRLNRIHLEEDAGKSLHDVDDQYSSIDLNRAGVPLIEIVSEPDIRSADEAYAYLSEIRKLVRYLDICDGNMEEGSLRCDANISVRKKGDEKLGTKVEIKNLNSIRNVKKAIEVESKRMIDLLEQGQAIRQETRSFDPETVTTFPMREKEEADDYRYFPDPDLTRFVLEDKFIATVKNTIPELQQERVRRYFSDYQLSEYDAMVLTEEKNFSDYFEQLVGLVGKENAKAAANWMLGPVRSWMNDQNLPIEEFPLQPKTLAAMIQMVTSEKMSFSVASTKLFRASLAQDTEEPEAIAKRNNWLQESDAVYNEKLIEEVLKKFPDKVIEYRKGKKGLMALFVGEVMKLSKGKADPRITTALLTEKLKA